jgi:hypothetical protein
MQQFKTGAIQRTGAITIEGTVNATIDSSLFTRLDGLGVFVGGYNRGLVIRNSTFEWLGGSAMAAWGDTSYAMNANGSRTIPWPRGPDARDGNQPIGTQILGNVINDIGIWQKQASFWCVRRNHTQCAVCSAVLQSPSRTPQVPGNHCADDCEGERV